MLDSSVRYIKGVGPKKEQVLAGLGLRNLRDLLYYFPFRYEDRTSLKKISQLEEKDTALVSGIVAARRLKKMPYFLRSRGSKVRDIFTAVIDDGSGRMDCVWFNQGWLADKIKVNDKILVYGKVGRVGRHLQMVCPQWEPVEGTDATASVGRIVGVYSSTPLFVQKFWRRAIFDSLAQCRKELNDPLPYNIRQAQNLPNIALALQEVHFPSSWDAAQAARERFIFEELFFSQVMVHLRKARHTRQAGPRCQAFPEILRKFTQSLCFELTAGQAQAVQSISADMGRPFPMRRLLQGDVGCGKTVVAAHAAAICAANHLQSAFLVPTEVLAYQHYQTLAGMFSCLGFKAGLLVASLDPRDAAALKQDLKTGRLDVVVGTHALIQEDVEFKDLGLCVIDEQHKFGVAQRAMLTAKGKVSPHYLVMSATPIPRSLALSIYGDLDLSLINEMPKTRVLAETVVVPQAKRKNAYELIRAQLVQGRQAYVVYSLIEESEEEGLKSVEEMHKKIARAFKGYKTAKFHGALKAKDKLEAIKGFQEKKIDILVCTTVVEVGVSVENATVMLVENPEQFGLAQLHQLRGRIQRASYQSYFIMLTADQASEEAKKRIDAIASSNDGFKIAEQDLLLRGPGDFFGGLQHGLPALKIANPLRDIQVLERAQVASQKLIALDPGLDSPQARPVKEYLLTLPLAQPQRVGVAESG